jgi:hypothetical protein
LDFDRINEEKEDFMTFDNRKRLTKAMRQSSPLNNSGDFSKRSIIGSQTFFKEGKLIKVKKE